MVLRLSYSNVYVGNTNIKTIKTTIDNILLGKQIFYT